MFRTHLEYCVCDTVDYRIHHMEVSLYDNFASDLESGWVGCVPIDTGM